MSHKLYYAGMPGDCTGWGVCNANLIRELEKICDLSYGEGPGQGNSDALLDHTVFMPIADHALRPTSHLRGWRNFGYCFFEYPLDPAAAENAKRYDLIFCGSTWCQERLAERGIKHTKVLVQGVDTSIFHPTEGKPNHPKDEVWIFSGGKFEYRKGQDLVLASFKEVLKTHPRARLITNWHNPWPETMETMRESKHIKYETISAPWDEQLGHLCTINGIPKERVLTTASLIKNADMADIYRQCDFGVFPNRCEGGTNLVMMEFMACGKVVVSNTGTGHRDVLSPVAEYIFIHTGKDHANGWRATDIDLLIGAMLIAIESGALDKIGRHFSDAMRQWTWERAARTIVEAL